jgi:hypothetical protein
MENEVRDQFDVVRNQLAEIYTLLGRCMSILLSTSQMATATKQALEFDPVLEKRYAEFLVDVQQSPDAALHQQAIDTIYVIAARLKGQEP